MSNLPVITSGKAYGRTDSHVWLRRHYPFAYFLWGGRCMRVEDGSEDLGGVSITTRQNVRGGVERHHARTEAPGTTSTSIVMKRLQRDRMKTELRRCWWDIDQRFHCGGMNRDAWNDWEEITRYCYGKPTGRDLTGSGWEGDEESEVTVNFDFLLVEDIYRVGGSEQTEIGGEDLLITDITVCQGKRCPDGCDNQEDCVIVAVTEDDLANPYLLVNEAGGIHDEWAATALTDFGAEDADAVACAGSFVIVVCEGDTSIIYSDDLGVTQVNVDENTVPNWAANPPRAIDLLDQTFIIIGGANGYIYRSTDGGVTWQTMDNGQATVSDIDEVAICRVNPQVIYAATAAADVVIKSENGGQTWFACTGTGTAGTGITALCVLDENNVLVGTDAGEVFQSEDGGVSWTEQTDLPGVTTKANFVIQDIVHSGCGVVWLVGSESGVQNIIFRNIDGGSQGRWFTPDDCPTLTDNVVAAAGCDANHLIAVGGTTATSSMAVYLH